MIDRLNNNTSPIQKHQLNDTRFQKKKKQRGNSNIKYNDN